MSSNDYIKILQWSLEKYKKKQEKSISLKAPAYGLSTCLWCKYLSMVCNEEVTIFIVRQTRVELKTAEIGKLGIKKQQQKTNI